MEDGALCRHPAVRGVVVPLGQEAFDRHSEESDPLVRDIYSPALECPLAGRHSGDLHAHITQFGPRASQELHRAADGELEPVQSAIQRWQRSPHHFASPQPPMATMPGGTWCGRRGVASTWHSPSLRIPQVVVLPRGAHASVEVGHSLGGMDMPLDTEQRPCSKVVCSREAVATLTYDYADQMAALGPLGPVGAPHAHDLCALHADRLSVPAGWLVVRHEALRA